MTQKMVVHIFHADKDSINTGSHVAERIRQIKDQQGVELEVYLFGPAERALMDPEAKTYCETIAGLINAGVPVRTCIDIANAMGAADELSSRGLQLEYACDAFARFAVEGATVISF